MSECTPAEIHVGVCERAAGMCVSVSSRGQAGRAEGEGVVASEVVWGRPLPDAVSLPWVPALGSPGEVWASKPYPSCSWERDLSWVKRLLRAAAQTQLKTDSRSPLCRFSAVRIKTVSFPPSAPLPTLPVLMFHWRQLGVGMWTTMNLKTKNTRSPEVQGCDMPWFPLLSCVLP